MATKVVFALLEQMKKTILALAIAVVAAGAMTASAVAAKKPVRPPVPVCQQVMTYAMNPATGETAWFGSPCDVPVGWVILPPPPVFGDETGL